MAEKVDDDQLTSIVANSIRDSLGYEGDDLSSNFRDNLARYEGAACGDERAGRLSRARGSRRARRGSSAESYPCGFS